MGGEGEGFFFIDYPPSIPHPKKLRLWVLYEILEAAPQHLGKGVCIQSGKKGCKKPSQDLWQAFPEGELIQLSSF